MLLGPVWLIEAKGIDNLSFVQRHETSLPTILPVAHEKMECSQASLH
jgi:hypothetical protein